MPKKKPFDPDKPLHMSTDCPECHQTIILCKCGRSHIVAGKQGNAGRLFLLTESQFKNSTKGER